MQVTCRRQDTKRFEDLGFTEQDAFGDPPKGDPSPIVEMVDQEANYAHHEEMPTDIPYYGQSEPGGCYGAEEFACNGQESAFVMTGHECGYVVNWLEGYNAPDLESVDRIRKYHRILAEVRAMFGETV